MKKNLLLRTNAIVCVVIVLGFAVTSFVSYHANRGIYERDAERVSALTSEGIYYQIDSIFTKPVNVSLTMANDSLLKEFLAEERSRMDDQDFIEAMRGYLLAYQEKYDYDSVFLVSTATNRYYHFNGVDRVLTEGNPENVWYYEFLSGPAEYALNIDNDEAADNEITVFINCKIRGGDGGDMGVVGVGFRVDSLQALLQSYEEQFDVEAYLVADDGTIEISTRETGYQATDFFSQCAFPDRQNQILSDRAGTQAFWYGDASDGGYVVAKYVPNLGWHLIIDYDNAELNRQLGGQFLLGVTVVVAILLFVLIFITSVIRKYNAQIIELTRVREQAHRDVFQEETAKLYENIYELDITHNRAASEETEHYFESLGVPRNTPFDEALQIIARKQIKEEFRAGYIVTFSPQNVLRAFAAGRDSLRYDFMITNDGENYYWMRITARIFNWSPDNSVRMLVFRQNISEEKRREQLMAQRVREDPMTGLLNKETTESMIRARLQAGPVEAEPLSAFLILDIDSFKAVNDTMGHAFGDAVIRAFGGILKAEFRKTDLLGRIGGDEFAVFLSFGDRQWLERKVARLSEALAATVEFDGRSRAISASIGVAVSPESGADFQTLYQHADEALYETKKRGKNGFTIYRPEA